MRFGWRFEVEECSATSSVVSARRVRRRGEEVLMGAIGQQCYRTLGVPFSSP